MTSADAEHYTDVGSTCKPPLTFTCAIGREVDVPNHSDQLTGLVDTHGYII